MNVSHALLTQKLELIQWLSTIEDISIIEKIYALRNNEHSDWWEEIDAVNKASIERGLNDLKNDRIHSDQAIRTGIRERILKVKKG
jgi:hypothetical protein